MSKDNCLKCGRKTYLCGRGILGVDGELKRRCLKCDIKLPETEKPTR